MWGERQWLKLGMTEVGMMVCLSVITISFCHGLSFEIINAFLTGLFCLRYHCLASKAGKGVWLEQPFYIEAYLSQSRPGWHWLRE